MAKIEKSIIEPKWVKIKELYELKTNGSDKYGTNFKLDGELDKLCIEFINLIGEATTSYGYNYIVEGVKLDLWKERIWSLVENAGLLPGVSSSDDNEIEGNDDWMQDDSEEFEMDIESKEHEAYTTHL
tara:strand:+ start:375 stop:758 length:384 start_codon:yes stop_codon:yes gene_type:complete